MSDLNNPDSRCESLIADRIPGVGAIMEQTVFAAGVAGLPGLRAKAIANFEGAIDYGLVGAFSSQLLSLEGTVASNAGKHHFITNSARQIQRPPSTFSAEHGSTPESNNFHGHVAAAGFQAIQIIWIIGTGEFSFANIR